MTIKKKGYVKPIIAAEEFVPQEYVAACAPEADGTINYYLTCQTGQAGAYDANERYHDPRTCGTAQSHTVTIVNNKITQIYEEPHSVGLGYIGGYADNIKIGGISSENVTLDPNATYNITWDTHIDRYLWTETYSHTGTLNLSQAMKVNMS